MRPDRAISGHVFRVEGKRRPVWRAKYRLPDGPPGPAHDREGVDRARPAARAVLHQAHGRGVAARRPRSGRARDAARNGSDWADVRERRGRVPALPGRRPAAQAVDGPRRATRCSATTCCRRSAYVRLEDITEQEVDRWARRLGADRPLSNATKRKVIVIFHGVMARACRVYGLPVNPVAKSRSRGSAAPGRHRRLQPGGGACARARGRRPSRTPRSSSRRRSPACARANSSRCAGATSTSPARTSASPRATPNGELSTPKSGQGAVGADGVGGRGGARAARANVSGSPRRTTSCSSVWSAATSTRLRCCGATARRCSRAGLRPLRFHDLRHIFGTRVIGHADIRRVQEWMGHADVQTTMRYLHCAPRHDDAALVGLKASGSDPQSDAGLSARRT